MSVKDLLEKQNLYPVLGTNPQEYVPYDMLVPHEAQALKNHTQTLLRLAERGGLGWGEILAILMGKPWSFAARIRKEKAKEIVLSLVEKRGVS